MPRNKQAIKNENELRSLARSYTNVCVQTLAHIVVSKSAATPSRVVAAGMLLDRGWGKAPTTIAGSDGGDIRVVIRQIVETAIESDAKLIEHEAIVDGNGDEVELG